MPLLFKELQLILAHMPVGPPQEWAEDLRALAAGLTDLLLREEVEAACAAGTATVEEVQALYWRVTAALAGQEDPADAGAQP